MRRVLLVGGQHRRLEWRITRLHDVSGALTVGRQPVRNRDDERVAARAERQLEGRDVEQDPVADLGNADERVVTECGDLAVARRDHELAHGGRARTHLAHDAVPPADHRRRVAWRTVSSRRTERLLNLVICLLHTRSFLTADRIRDLVPGYDDAPSEEAFKRAFERDKEDLRDLGIPLETGTNSAFDDEPGYRIARRDYALPDLTLEPDEAAAVGLAARTRSSAAVGAAATRALRKLEAAGVELTSLP